VQRGLYCGLFNSTDETVLRVYSTVQRGLYCVLFCVHREEEYEEEEEEEEGEEKKSNLDE
jgi:hypothetical protein